MALQQALQLFEQFKAAFYAEPCDFGKCSGLVGQLKIAMTQLQSLPTAGQKQSPTLQQELLICREILELASMLAIRMKDIPAFERHIAQLKTYYFDYAHLLPPSQRQFPILGLNLLRLLAQNRIGEFHTELELIPVEHHSNVYISHPIMVEQYLMEGSYNKVLNARHEAPAETYAFFMDILLHTVRDEIADCSQQSYDKLPASAARTMLMFNNDGEFREYCAKREWTVSNDGWICFARPDADKLEVPSMKLITQTLAYAKELERIV
eukprot:tig00000545_g1991.t1